MSTNHEGTGSKIPEYGFSFDGPSKEVLFQHFRLHVFPDEQTDVNRLTWLEVTVRDPFSDATHLALMMVNGVGAPFSPDVLTLSISGILSSDSVEIPWLRGVFRPDWRRFNARYDPEQCRGTSLMPWGWPTE